MSRKFLVSYADGWTRESMDFYREAQQKNARTGRLTLSFDRFYPYGRRNIELGFYTSNKYILDQPRGVGYWLWKPYIVDLTLRYMDDGDFLFYSDSRVEFLKNIQPLYDLNLQSKHGITAFKLNPPCFETRNTKKYAFVYLGCDDPKYYTGENKLQNLASFFLIRKTDFSAKFISEWLLNAQNADVITDKSIVGGCLDNHPDFMDDRHDQSIFSLLLKKHEIETYIDPSQYGNDWRPPNYFYDQLLLHTR